MAASYVAYSAVQGPSTVMIRPHPNFWRVVHGVCTIYLLSLVFLLMQGKDEARQLLKVRLRLPLCFQLGMSSFTFLHVRIHHMTIDVPGQNLLIS
jgi:Phosphatidyl serine synthase